MTMLSAEASLRFRNGCFDAPCSSYSSPTSQGRQSRIRVHRNHAPNPSRSLSSRLSFSEAFSSVRLRHFEEGVERNLGRGQEEGGRRGGRAGNVRCMANPRRVLMVAQQIKREIAEMLIKDDVLRSAVVPEHALGADKYLTSVATISEVEVSSDLTVAKVFVSIYGDDRGQEVAMAGLKDKAKYVRFGLGKRMRLRFTPEVRFVKDDSLERGSRVLGILDKLQAEREARERGEAVKIDPFDDEEEEEALARGKPRLRKRKANQGAARAGVQPTKMEHLDKDGGNGEEGPGFEKGERIIFVP